jgi:hypothetical protein
MRSRFSNLCRVLSGPRTDILQPFLLADWMKHINVFIGLPNVEDSKAVYADIP